MRVAALVPDEPILSQRYPLAALLGERPQRPGWFDRALFVSPERESIAVAGAAIEMLAWGRRGAPGVVLVHGSRAHADWWSFIAPFLASDYRVAALSLSGMGRSEWRDAYATEIFADEIATVAVAAGLFESNAKPVLVGHSFGGFPIIELAAREGERWRGAVLIDTHFDPEAEFGRLRDHPAYTVSNVARTYPSEVAALARFRLIPPHHRKNLHLIDHVARGGLRSPPEGTRAEWTWCFDPALFEKMNRRDPVAGVRGRRCPMALIWGEHSPLYQPDYARWIHAVIGKDAPAIAIPEAGHHVLLDQPLALIATLRALLSTWPQ